MRGYGFVIGAALMGCACSPPLPETRAAQAAPALCRGAASGPEEARLLRSATVAALTPKVHQDACKGACTVFGVGFELYPPPGASVEALGQAIRCHGVRALLREDAFGAIPNDPYVVPDGLVEIEEDPRGDHLYVVLRGEDISQNIAVLHRATAFAAEHRR